MRPVVALTVVLGLASCEAGVVAGQETIRLPLTFAAGQVYGMEIVKTREEWRDGVAEAPSSARFVSRIAILETVKEGFVVAVTTEPGFLGALAAAPDSSGLPRATIEYVTDDGLMPLRLRDRDAILAQIDDFLDALVVRSSDPERARVRTRQLREQIMGMGDDVAAWWLGEDLVLWSLVHGLEIGADEVISGEVEQHLPLLGASVPVNEMFRVASATPESVVVRVAWEPTPAALEAITARTMEMWEATPGMPRLTLEERAAHQSFNTTRDVTITLDRVSGVATVLSMVQEVRIGARRRIERWEATIRRVR